MRRGFFALLIFLAGLAAGVGYSHFAPAAAKERSLMTRRVELLGEENERLRGLVEHFQKAGATERNKAQREAIERDVAALRGLAFNHPVEYEVLTRVGIREVMGRKMDEVYSREEFSRTSAALSRMGLLEEGFPLRQKYIDLLGEQVAAFYDQHTHKLFMFEDATLDNAQNRIVLAHELTHALQDQHFGLARLPLEIKTNDDAALAASALCEGEATLVMSEYMLKNLSLDAIKASLGSALTQNMDQLAGAPRYMREMLIFPYLRGQEFCSALQGPGGYEALTQAYARPPGSSSQILHPAKFTGARREDPLTVSWGALDLEGKAPETDNVLGEMGIRILMSEWLDPGTAEQVSAGWRGDRYLCFENGAALVWRTLWESPESAARFLKAQQAVLAKRYAKANPPRITRCVLVHETEVLVLDAATASLAAALEARFGQ